MFKNTENTNLNFFKTGSFPKVNFYTKLLNLNLYSNKQTNVVNIQANK